MDRKRVVVTEIGVVTPIGTNAKEFWESCLAGRCGIKSIDLHEKVSVKVGAPVDNFFPEESPGDRKIKAIDPFAQLAIGASQMAFESAGITASPDNVGIFTGSAFGGIRTAEEGALTFLSKGPRYISPSFIKDVTVNAPAGEIAILNGLRGANVSFSSGEASGATSVVQAYYHLLTHNNLDIILAGGSDTSLTPVVADYFSSLGIVSTNMEGRYAGPFDIETQGLSLGEGAGFLVLETMESAQKRSAKILAEIVGCGQTYCREALLSGQFNFEKNKLSQYNCMHAAFSEAGISPFDIDYINAHGSGIKKCDQVELEAIKETFGEETKNIPITSTKSLTGNMFGGSSPVELAACVLSLETGKIHPMTALENPVPGFDFVRDDARKGKIDITLSNSFSCCGANVSIVLRKFE